MPIGAIAVVGCGGVVVVMVVFIVFVVVIGVTSTKILLGKKALIVQHVFTAEFTCQLVSLLLL